MTKNVESLRGMLLDAIARWREDRSTNKAGVVMFLAALLSELGPEAFDVNG